MVGAGRRKVITCHVYGESRIPATVSHRTSKCTSRVPHGPEVLWRGVRGRAAPGGRAGGRVRGGGRAGTGGGATREPPERATVRAGGATSSPVAPPGRGGAPGARVIP